MFSSFVNHYVWKVLRRVAVKRQRKNHKKVGGTPEDVDFFLFFSLLCREHWTRYFVFLVVVISFACFFRLMHFGFHIGSRHVFDSLHIFVFTKLLLQFEVAFEEVLHLLRGEIESTATVEEGADSSESFWVDRLVGSEGADFHININTPKIYSSREIANETFKDSPSAFLRSIPVPSTQYISK